MITPKETTVDAVVVGSGPNGALRRRAALAGIAPASRRPTQWATVITVVTADEFAGIMEAAGQIESFEYLHGLLGRLQIAAVVKHAVGHELRHDERYGVDCAAARARLLQEPPDRAPGLIRWMP